MLQRLFSLSLSHCLPYARNAATFPKLHRELFATFLAPGVGECFCFSNYSVGMPIVYAFVCCVFCNLHLLYFVNGFFLVSVLIWSATTLPHHMASHIALLQDLATISSCCVTMRDYCVSLHHQQLPFSLSF